MKDKKINEYPELTNKALLHLIRANQLLAVELEKRVQLLELVAFK